MIKTCSFSPTADGRPVTGCVISGGKLSVTVMDLGLTLCKIEYDGVDVLCGYDDTAGYQENDGFVGATIGRYGNRINGGTFTLNGITYDVGCNEKTRPTHLHGGAVGFDKHIWAATVVNDRAVQFRLVSEDGDQGYPGRLEAAVTVTVTEDDAVKLDYRAVSDKDTVFNPTNHAYFNLNGYAGGDVLNTELMIRADAITPVNEHLIPTGEYLPVEGTPFDFRTAKPIGRDIGADHPQLHLGSGYDHNFVLSSRGTDEPAIVAYSPKTGIVMECFTTEPGVQLYTGNFLDANAGKGGIALYRHQGFCLETQHFPDSPNHPEFPSATLPAGTVFESTTVYRFSKK